jgi:hypothetical protein
MRLRRFRLPFFFALVEALLAATPSQAQVYVTPRRAFKGQVHHFDLQWRHIDMYTSVTPPEEVQPEGSPAAPATPTGPEVPATPAPPPGSSGSASATLPPAPTTPATSAAATVPAPAASPMAPPPDPMRPPAQVQPPAAKRPVRGGGGVRLYFYDRERETAERAAATIGRAYTYLAERFHYVPQRRFEYFLYSSYQEFLETNLFPMEEGVLGVTSPVDLKLTLPYLGDHELFEQVSTHEMTHQFTIQKVMTRAKEAKVSGDPLSAMPLWFVEGMAEYYARHGIDPEADMLARDLVVNPDIESGYALLDFFDDQPYRFGNGSFVIMWTYKIGQVRCAFLEETYGEGTIQKVLDQSPRLVSSGTGGFRNGRTSFVRLLEQITGDKQKVIAGRFEEWLKRRAYPTYIDSRRSPLDMPADDWGGRLSAINTSPDGTVLMYRVLNLETGQTELGVFDARAPYERQRVAIDGGPGVESLHPVFGRNFALTNDTLVYVAQSGAGDVVYWQPYKHKAEPISPRAKEGRDDMARGVEFGAPPGSNEPTDKRHQSDWKVQLTLGAVRAYELAEHGIIAAESPALSPDGSEVAFIGINEEGVRDIYVLAPHGATYDLRRLTNDVWAERHVTWGKMGIVFTSDATENGKFNLFVVSPDGSERKRLTFDDRDDFDPQALPDGRLFFVAYDKSRADVHEVVGDTVVRRTSVATGLFDLSAGPEGGLWALWQHSGERAPVRLKRDELGDLNEPVVSTSSMVSGEPRLVPQTSLAGAVPYNPYKTESWQLGTLFGFLGAGGGSVFGEIMASASDRLRNHAVLLDLAIYGSLDLTEGQLLYLNQEHWMTFGGGPFQSLNFRVDRTFGRLTDTFTSGERFFGGLGLVRYPFNSFEYAEASLAIGGVQPFIDNATRSWLQSTADNGSGQDLLSQWDERNHGTKFQTEATLSLGHDTVRYNGLTGPFDGNSLLLSGSITTRPGGWDTFGDVRLDAAQYIHVLGPANLMLRLAAGTAIGGRLARGFYLSSWDTLRGVEFGDTDFLLGRGFAFTTAEFQFPLTSIVRVVFLPNIEGIVGADFGGVGNTVEEAVQKRVFDFVLGTNFVFGPLVLRLHFAKPIATGGDPRKVNVDRNTPEGHWITNFSLGWLYF